MLVLGWRMHRLRFKVTCIDEVERSTQDVIYLPEMDPARVQFITTLKRANNLAAGAFEVPECAGRVPGCVVALA